VPYLPLTELPPRQPQTKAPSSGGNP
jgi:hypothetical protein